MEFKISLVLIQKGPLARDEEENVDADPRGLLRCRRTDIKTINSKIPRMNFAPVRTAE